MTLDELQTRTAARVSLADSPDQDLIDLVMAIAVQLLAERLGELCVWPSDTRTFRHRACQCGHGGCGVEAIECVCGQEVEFYCPAHAREHGYCPGCGQFWAGTQAFDSRGWCPMCGSGHV